MIKRAIQELMDWIQDLKRSLAHKDKEAVSKALDGLSTLGVTISDNTVERFGTIPTLPDGEHVENAHIVKFNKVRDPFLADYNTHLRNRGKKPVRPTA